MSEHEHRWPEWCILCISSGAPDSHIVEAFGKSRRGQGLYSLSAFLFDRLLPWCLAGAGVLAERRRRIGAMDVWRTVTIVPMVLAGAAGAGADQQHTQPAKSS